MTHSNRIDESSHDYGYRDGGSDVERTLKMVASGVVGRENRAEVSLKSYVLILLASMFSQFLECLLRSSFFLFICDIHFWFSGQVSGPDPTVQITVSALTIQKATKVCNFLWYNSQQCVTQDIMGICTYLSLSLYISLLFIQPASV